jgi:hypothetical protein
MHRNRMISFRVSDEEFEKLRSFCHSRGDHNVSEIARTAVQKLVDGSESAQPLESRIQAVEQEIRRLDALLTHNGQDGE